MPSMQAPRRPPVLDMTPEGEFRDPAPRRTTMLDRLLGRIGGVALLLALGAGGLVLAGLAVLAIGLLLPLALLAGLVAFGALWWRLRRAGLRPGALRFTVGRR